MRLWVYLRGLLGRSGVNEADDDKTDLIQDLASIVYSFSARLYGLRRAKKKTEEIMRVIQGDE